MSNPPQKYFQLGGYSPHITWLQHTYDDTALADAIVGIGSPLRGGKRLDEPVDLILGITEHGSSHLLLTGPQVLKLKRISRLSFPSRLPFLASDFESLSPVSFFSVDELVKKLAFHKPKAKGKKSGSDAPADSSQANKGYNPGIKNLYRGAFEHGRILFRILNEALRDLSPDTFGIDDNSWINEVGISSFVFNTKGVDDRPASERLKNPHVLDIGFCNATLPDITPEYQTARHIVHAGNALLHRQGKKQPFRYGSGNTEQIDATTLQKSIQDLFHECKQPTILLVHNEEETMSFIRNMGVDVSQWCRGIRGLLYAPPPRGHYNDPRDSRNAPRHHRSGSQSLSPHRRGDHRSYSNHSGYSNSRQDSYSNNRKQRRPVYAPVYVLDIQLLYRNLMQAEDAQDVVDVAYRLNEPVDNGWCAGNEAPLLIDIWRSMISGPPIDDQRDLRMGGRTAPNSAPAGPTPGPSTAPSSSGTPHQQSGADGSESEDSEEDPNAYHDRILNQRQAQRAPEAPHKIAGYVDLDESDYGSDSDESD